MTSPTLFIEKNSKLFIAVLCAPYIIPKDIKTFMEILNDFNDRYPQAIEGKICIQSTHICIFLQGTKMKLSKFAQALICCTDDFQKYKLINLIYTEERFFEAWSIEPVKFLDHNVANYILDNTEYPNLNVLINIEKLPLKEIIYFGDKLRDLLKKSKMSSMPTFHF